MTNYEKVMSGKQKQRLDESNTFDYQEPEPILDNQEFIDCIDYMKKEDDNQGELMDSSRYFKAYKIFYLEYK